MSQPLTFPLGNHTSPESTIDREEQNRRWLRNKLGIDNNTKDSNIKLHNKIWKEVQGVQVMQGRWFNNLDGLSNFTVVVLLRGKQSEYNFQPFTENNDWQLRLIILKKKQDIMGGMVQSMQDMVVIQVLDGGCK